MKGRECILTDGVRQAVSKFVPHLAHIIVGKNVKQFYSDIDPSSVSINDEIVVKYGPEVTCIEADTLRFAAKETSLPVPVMKGFCHGEEGDGYLVMSYVHGSVLYDVWDSLSLEQKCSLISQLAEYFRELHSLTQPYIGAVGRRHPLDKTFKDANPLGPYDTEREMNEAILRARRVAWEDRGGSPPESFVSTQLPWLPADHKIAFCHGDVNMSNIIVEMEDKRIAGIVGWKQAGFYPEHWDFVNALVLQDPDTDWIEYVPQVFKPYYAEYALWHRLRQISILGFTP